MFSCLPHRRNLRIVLILERKERPRRKKRKKEGRLKILLPRRSLSRSENLLAQKEGSLKEKSVKRSTYRKSPTTKKVKATPVRKKTGRMKVPKKRMKG